MKCARVSHREDPHREVDDMPRTVKTAEERKLEIIETSERMFRENGYANTSVNAIIKEIGIAKGTFYHHYKSKEEVLEAIVDHTLDQIVGMAEQVADDPSMDALTKMRVLLSDSHIGDEETSEVAEHLHLPGNRELHEATNIQTVLRLSPVFARIVEQGNEENVFNAKRPLETMQFLLTGSQFLLDGGLFDFSEDELLQRRLVTQEIVEKALGARRGTFNFMNE
jgi:AcrR family transcriptional regulator